MSVGGQRTDGELLQATRAGEGLAFATFYRRHLPRVVAFLMRETGDREASADLAAEVFAAVLVSARRFRSRDGGSAWLWVRGIAQNKLRDSRRHGRVEDRARRRLALEPESLDDDDLARVDELASGPGVLALVDELPPRQRAAITGRIVQGREYADIAAQLECYGDGRAPAGEPRTGPARPGPRCRRPGVRRLVGAAGRAAGSIARGRAREASCPAGERSARAQRGPGR